MDGSKSGINRILEEATHIVGGCKETAGNVEQAEGYEGKQIEKYAQIRLRNKDNQ